MTRGQPALARSPLPRPRGGPPRRPGQASGGAGPGRPLRGGGVNRSYAQHPELVAERIGRFARLVGRDAVIAGTDCGLGGRVHPQLAWAKLQSLAQGATLATQQLWR